VKKESDGNGGVVSPWSVSFSSLFSLFGILSFPRKLKKGGGKDPPDPLPRGTANKGSGGTANEAPRGTANKGSGGTFKRHTEVVFTHVFGDIDQNIHHHQNK
jgi:hypothetical protein